MRYDLLETTADDFIADAVREIAQTDIGFTNGFRFGVPVPPETVTEADLWNLLPMDARMKRGWVTGKELRDYLENELEMVYAKTPLKLNGGWGPRASGMTVVFDARAELGRRLVSIKINGREAEADEHYTIAGCEREGEPLDVVCRHRGTHDAQVLPMSIHEALQEYLKVHPVIAPRRDGRERALDLPPSCVQPRCSTRRQEICTRLRRRPSVCRPADRPRLRSPTVMERLRRRRRSAQRATVLGRISQGGNAVRASM